MCCIIHVELLHTLVSARLPQHTNIKPAEVFLLGFTVNISSDSSMFPPLETCLSIPLLYFGIFILGSSGSSFFPFVLRLCEFYFYTCSGITSVFHSLPSFVFIPYVSFQLMINNTIPMCSYQYERMFNSSRIPGIETGTASVLSSVLSVITILMHVPQHLIHAHGNNFLSAVTQDKVKTGI